MDITIEHNEEFNFIRICDIDPNFKVISAKFIFSIIWILHPTFYLFGPMIQKAIIYFFLSSSRGQKG